MTKPGRHVALVVEDEPQMAAELGELLDSMGHDHRHAATKEDAERLVEAGEFCYALLDLEIKVNADSIRPRVEAGESLLELIRERYPNRNDVGEHQLPILMVSGHSETRYVVKSFQSRADDFITKPVGENHPPFKEKIQAALRKSGRDQHVNCAAIMRAARAAQRTASAAPALAITGRQVGKRFEVTLGDAPLELTNASFTMLLRLVVGRLAKPEGWVHKSELGETSDQGWKGPSRLRTELGAATKLDVIENDGSGSYRLHLNIAIGCIDTARLAAGENATITQLAERIQQLPRSVTQQRQA